LLGIGPDGHAASLFPNEPTLDERERRAIPAEAKLEPLVDRVTMTVPVLCSAPAVVFIVTGGEKAEAVERAFARPPGPSAPASLIRSTTGRTRVVADAAAAAGLRR
jgi:6-phosphogluconolactonase